MPTEIYIPSHLLPIDAVQLGQFVLNIEYPEQDFHNPEALAASNPRVIRSSQASFSETFKRTNRSPAKRFLTTPVAAHYRSEGNLTAKVESASTSIHQLENPSDIFYDICKATNTEKWLKRAIGRRRKVYMIVGLQILTDAEVSSEGLQTQNQGGRLTVSSSMGIPGVAPTGGNIIQNSAELTNLQVSGGQNKSTSQDFRFVAPGEQIYAIQYRRISFKWYSRRNFDKAELEKPKWWKVHTRRS